MPNYLRTLTIKYKGSITEKIASNYLRKKGFDCESYGKVAYYKKLDWEEWALLQKNRSERDLKKYSSKTKPEWWDKVNPHLNWEKYQQDQLKSAQNRMKDVKQTYPIFQKEEREFERIWGKHIKIIQKYKKWLKEYGHYRPDFVAKKGDKIFIVEVKSQSLEGKTALFGEHQQKALLKANDFGLTPILLIVPLNLNVEIGEIQLRDI